MVILVLENQYKEISLKAAETFLFQKTNVAPDDSYYLVYEQGRLRLKDHRQGQNFFVEVNPEDELDRLKRQKVNYKKDMLSRAVGYKGDPSYVIFDGTMGFAKDDFHFINLGAKVIACDHNSVVFALVKDAIDRSSFLQERMQIFLGDSQFILEQEMGRFDCLYLDPMFENFKKKSKPKKEMAFLREIQADELGVQDILTRALDLKVKRIVVKRPSNGDHLVTKPNNILNGKLIRYDIYKRQ